MNAHLRISGDLEPFAELLRGTEPKTLRQCIIAAVDAAEVRSSLLRGDGDEYAIDAAERRADETRQALLDHLLFEHGVGGTLASKISEVI